MMARLEFMLAVLHASGATVAEAMTYAALIDRHIYGSGMQEAEGGRHGTGPRPRRSAGAGDGVRGHA